MKSLCFLILLYAANLFLIGACSNLLDSASELQGLPTIHGDKWADKLVTWSVIGIVIGVIQTFCITAWFCIISKLPEGSPNLKMLNGAFCAVEIILVALALTSIIVPGIDQWPEQYTETNLAMYSAIVFIALYALMAIVMFRSLFVKRGLQTVIE